MGDCDGDQLLGLLRQRSFSKDGATEVVERFVDGWGELDASLADLRGAGW
ncbi:hypothetical protein [Streptomyces platensis]|nr:hypothetical protein [Streptomyces platensis]